jgi:serine/threonine protein kinase
MDEDLAWAGEHPDPVRLQALAGQLPAARDPACMAHLKRCASCRQTFESFRALDGSGSGNSNAASLEEVHGSTTLPVSAETSTIHSGKAFPFLQAGQSPDELGRLPGYRVLELLGAGGMGLVFLGEDLLLSRSVAIKLIKPEICDDPEVLQRFMKEARAAAQVDHPNIVPIHHVGEYNEAHFIVMPLLRGQPLDKLLEQQKSLPQDEALRIAQEIAAGLVAAHEHPLHFIHRDIKPKNVFVEQPSGNVRILDFGLARAAADARLTRTGATLGTPSYMSPEQASGKPVDHRSDLFSLGATLYRMAVGAPPFPGKRTEDVLINLLQCQPIPPDQANKAVSPDVSDYILKLMSRSPADRPASAREVMTRLQALRQAPAAPPRKVPPSAATRMMLLALGIGLFAVAIGWIIYLASGGVR